MVDVELEAKRSSSSVSSSSYSSSSSTTDLRFLRASISGDRFDLDVLEGVAWNDRAIARAGRGLQTHRVRAADTSGRRRLDIVYK